MLGMRLTTSLTTLLAALAFTGPAVAAPSELVVDRGVVQSVTTSGIVLRELDGSVVSLVVGPATRVRLNGLPATLADVRPGFVAGVVHDGTAPAILVRAFGRLVDRGAIVSTAGRQLTIRADSGQTLTFRVGARTLIFWRGLQATRAALRPGRLAIVTHTAAGEALRVAVRPRRLL
jgi:hypothetical protein